MAEFVLLDADIVELCDFERGLPHVQRARRTLVDDVIPPSLLDDGYVAEIESGPQDIMKTRNLYLHSRIPTIHTIPVREDAQQTHPLLTPTH